jgi:hypothetical protein
MISPFILFRSSSEPVALPSRHSRTAGLEFDTSSKKFCLARPLAVMTDGFLREIFGQV